MRWHTWLFVAAVALVGSNAFAVRPTPNASFTVSNGGGTYLLCPDGKIYFLAASGAGPWGEYATLPVAITEVAHWSGRAIALASGEVRWTDGTNWYVRASLPVASDEVAAWDNSLLITRAGASWYYWGPTDEWIRSGDLPCAAPVVTHSANIGSVKALYR